jgi:tellurite resistance-related uncharacterized protein
MKQIPIDAICYKSTAEFTQDTIPSGLLRHHSTAPNVWARICILEGSLLYRIFGEVHEVHTLTPGNYGVVEPQVIHEIEAVGPVRFYVAFHRQ